MVALPTLLKGGRVVIADGFDPGHVLSTIESDRITHLFGVPTMLDALSSHPSWQSADLSSIRRIVVAAAPIPPQTLRTFSERGITMCQGYGLTESGPGALILTAENAERKAGTAGVPHFFTDVRIVTAAGEHARPRERGEIQISGPNVMTAYWNRPDAFADAVTTDGWLRSGDVGVADDDGFVTIVDRLKDVIISGGENVYPAEVEAELIEMPQVRSCAVFGIPDPRWGETPCAAVTVADGATIDLAVMTNFLATRLARYKIPTSLVVTDEIPSNATGKVRKNELRERYGTDRR
jgi:fatty-acyl-CoA synthase